MDGSLVDDPSLVGEACHIVAKETSGPRGLSTLTDEQRDKYENLILLCNIHHKLIDDQCSTYPVQRLQTMKASHERWVRESLQSFDRNEQRDREIYADYVEEWGRRVALDQWRSWSANVLGGDQPLMSVRFDSELNELRTWLFTRIWPDRYPELKATFENFRRVLEDFQENFRQNARRIGENEEYLQTEKFYHIREWDPERYQLLFRRYTFHVELVNDLMLELTRAANYLCDQVRKYLDPVFRRQEGIIVVESGPYIDFTYRLYRPEYRMEERTQYPYPGLEAFIRARMTRDRHFGKGTTADDPEFLADLS